MHQTSLNAVAFTFTLGRTGTFGRLAGPSILSPLVLGASPAPSVGYNAVLAGVAILVPGGSRTGDDAQLRHQSPPRSAPSPASAAWKHRPTPARQPKVMARLTLRTHALRYHTLAWAALLRRAYHFLNSPLSAPGC